MSATLDTIRAAASALVERETERDPVPAAILKYAQTRAGKPVTKRDADAIAALFPGLDVWIKKEDMGTRIVYSVPVHLNTNHGGTYRNAESLKRMSRAEQVAAGLVYGSGWTGKRDADGEAIRDPEKKAQEVALYALGVPRQSDAYGIQIRKSNWSDPNRGAGVTRWPTVKEIREMNPSSYRGAEERNARRAVTAEVLAKSDEELARIATLVDTINDMAQELRGYLEGSDANPTPNEIVRAVCGALSVVLEKTDGDR